MKKLIIFLCLMITIPVFIMAQDPNTIEFDYDNAGNRTVRRALYIPAIIPTVSGQDDDHSFKAILVDSTTIDDISISIFPNPTLNRFIVQINNLDENDKAEFALVSLSGNIIQNKEILSGETEIDLQSCKSGPYVFRLLLNGESKTWKIIKR